jgi:flagellar assembly protein FliH
MNKTHIKPFSFTRLNAEDDDVLSKIIKGGQGFTPLTKQNEEIEEITYTAEQLEESEKEGYERGKIDGINEGRKDSYALDQQLIEVVSKIAPTMQNLFTSYNQKIQNSTDETVALAVKIAQKIAGDALAENPLPIIEKATKQCLEFLFKEPHVNIIVHDSLAEQLKTNMVDITSATGFDGNVEINGNPNIALGDCKIEWKGGGAEVNAESRIQDIDKIISSINKTATSTNKE